VSRRLPSGANAKRRKKEVRVSLAYRWAFFIPRPVTGGICLGDGSIGMTAGKGMEGAGEAERLDENDDLRLWLITLGGFMGRGIEVGVPGADGTGDPTDETRESMEANCDRDPKSGGAGEFDEIRRGGRSALL
jgi:hypothetical protein